MSTTLLSAFYDIDFLCKTEKSLANLNLNNMLDKKAVGTPVAAAPSSSFTPGFLRRHSASNLHALAHPSPGSCSPKFPGAPNGSSCGPAGAGGPSSYGQLKEPSGGSGTALVNKESKFRDRSFSENGERSQHLLHLQQQQKGAAAPKSTPRATRPSCAGPSRRAARASTARSASSRTASMSCAASLGTPSTRRSCAAPSTPSASAPTARAAISSTTQTSGGPHHRGAPPGTCERLARATRCTWALPGSRGQSCTTASVSPASRRATTSRPGDWSRRCCSTAPRRARRRRPPVPPPRPVPHQPLPAPPPQRPPHPRAPRRAVPQRRRRRRPRCSTAPEARRTC